MELIDSFFLKQLYKSQKLYVFHIVFATQMERVG